MAKISINMDTLKDKKEIKRHKVNDGDNVYRILPPFGENANGSPYRKWSLSWMADPESQRRRPYPSRTSFGEKDCPIWEYVNLLEQKAENLEKKLIKAGHDDEDIKEALRPILSTINEIKPKSSFIYNACNKSGEVGVLEIKKTAHDQVKKLMMEYITDYGQDPTSLASDADDSGVWIKINRTGLNRDTKYTVKKNQIKKKGSDGITWVDDREALPENVVENYEDLAYDLHTMYREIPADKLKEALIFNISLLAASFDKEGLDGKLILLPGYELTEEIKNNVKKPKVAVEDDEEENQKPRGKKPVNLKLDSDDDENEEEDEEPVVSKPVAKTATKPVAKLVVEDEEDDVPPPKVRPTAPASAVKPVKKPSVIDQAVLDEVESLLDD